jgi:hypothetical protein
MEFYEAGMQNAQLKNIYSFLSKQNFPEKLTSRHNIQPNALIRRNG